MKRSEDASIVLLGELAGAERGPRRDGMFAVWLTVRVASDMVEEPSWSERAQRRRLQALESRMTSLNLPAPLRRALTATLTQLRDPPAGGAAMALTQLVAPVRDSLGGETAEAVRRVAASLRGR